MISICSDPGGCRIPWLLAVGGEAGAGWWAAALLAAVLAAGWAASWMRQKRWTRELRRRIADDLHDDVGGNLGAIRMLAQAAPATLEEAGEDLQRIARLAEDSAEALRAIVWIVDSPRSSLGELLERLQATAEDLLAGVDHELAAECPPRPARRLLRPEFRRHVLLAFKEALHNAVRHAAADRVLVSIAATADALTFRVQDNGRGIAAQAAPGRGLASLRARAAALGGRASVTSSDGAGVTLEFVVPLRGPG